MNVDLILNIVYGILFAYFIIVVFKSVFRLVEVLSGKLVVYLREKRVNKNVDEENNNLIFYLCNIGESCICPIYVWNHRITPDAYSRDAAR